MLKCYINVVLMVLLFILLLGGIIPSLISAKANIAVFLGFMCIIVAIPIYYYWIKKVITMFKGVQIDA